MRSLRIENLSMIGFPQEVNVILIFEDRNTALVKLD